MRCAELYTVIDTFVISTVLSDNYNKLSMAKKARGKKGSTEEAGEPVSPRPAADDTTSQPEAADVEVVAADEPVQQEAAAAEQVDEVTVEDDAQATEAAVVEKADGAEAAAAAL